jgi:succinate-acetate transporter protein
MGPGYAHKILTHKPRAHFLGLFLFCFTIFCLAILLPVVSVHPLFAIFNFVYFTAS